LRGRTVIAASLLAALLSSSALAANGPIKSIRLSAGGVAEIVRSAHVADEGFVDIDVPLTQVDDFLKSLVVFSDKGSVRDVSLAGENPAEQTFSTLPFSPDDLSSLPALLQSLRGSTISMQPPGEAAWVNAQVIGVRPGPLPTRPPVLLVLRDGVLSTVPIDNAFKVKFTDPAVQAKIAKAAGLLSQSATDRVRSVRLGLDGVSQADIDISYVVPAPVWKTSHRLIVKDGGKARLQTWAVLENASGEDWKDVSIALSSGRPITLKQRLHAMIWKDRSEVRVSTSPELDKEGADASADTLAGPTPAEALPAAPMMMKSRAMAEVSQPSTTPDADEGDVISTFNLPGTYDVANGNTLSLPIVDATVDAEFVALYREGLDHPSAALLLKNDTAVSLPPGIVTVYDEKTGYVGDARLDNIQPGGTRTAVFAVDQKITEGSETRTASQVTKIKVDGSGILTATVDQSQTTTFTIKGGDTKRTIVIDQPIAEGWALVPGQGVEETPEGVRLRVEVVPGELKKASLKFRQTTEETQATTDLDMGIIAQWIGETPDAATKAKLEKLVDARSKQNDLASQSDSISGDIDGIFKDQERIRQNIQSVATGSLHDRWIKEMDTLEDRLQEARDRQASLEKATAQSRSEIDAIIRTL